LQNKRLEEKMKKKEIEIYVKNDLEIGINPDQALMLFAVILLVSMLAVGYLGHIGIPGFPHC
jgi:hypothetical protein